MSTGRLSGDDEKGYDGMEARYMLGDVGFMQAFGYSSFKLKG
jgi:hypothetical protein